MIDIIKSKTALLHFLIVFIVTLLACGLIWFLVIPLVYWLTFGEGEASARIDNLYINIFISNWLPLILVFTFCMLGIINNYKKHRLSNAKSYFLTFIFIWIIYAFKISIAGFIIRFF